MSDRVAGFIDWLETPAGRLPRICGDLTFADHLGACLARWGIGRMSYIVPPGLYAIGAPTDATPVIVTANYKMTYDLVRQALRKQDAWLLVLETYGINVWCAAGKGTFGTGEVVRRVVSTGLGEVVSHRRLILPLLGAPGVKAHEVTQRCGFTVRYAGIRAADLPAYLDNGQIVTPAMRALHFSFYDRLVLVPVEAVLELRTLTVISTLAALAGLAGGALATGAMVAGVYLGAAFGGLVAAPLLLPWLPGRSFAVKGATVGLLWTLFCVLLAGGNWSPLAIAAAGLLLPAVSAYHALNFSGCTPYASRSGVKKEMRLGLPVMALATVAGLVLLAFDCLVR